MKAREYIEGRLAALAEPMASARPDDNEALAKAIVKALMSRKFRKYAATPQLLEHINAAVRLNIGKGEPINLTFLNGAYKLWRLDESPEVDWAEFFTVIHYSNWVKPVCAIYGPGVWFDFFEDDLIVPRLNHMSAGDVDAYLASFQKMLDFLRAYQPKNLRMTLTRVGDQFSSPEAFFASVDGNIQKVRETLPNGLPTLNKADVAMLDLNVMVTAEELEDPHWREKSFLIHEGYSISKRATGYHFVPSKILVFTLPLPSGVVLAVGTVRSSVAKFWIGVGVLERKNGSFYPAVLTPGQLKAGRFGWEDVRPDGLIGKNFGRIRLREEAEGQS